MNKKGQMHDALYGVKNIERKKSGLFFSHFPLSPFRLPAPLTLPWRALQVAHI